MTVPIAVAGYASLLLVAVTLLVLAAMGLGHRRRLRREQHEVRRRAELTPLVHTLLDDEDERPAPEVTAAPALFDELVLDLLPSLRGSDRDALQRVLATRGVLDRAARDLGSRAAWRRGRAATLLGSAAGTQHTAALVRLLADPDADVRSAATRALGKTGDVAAAEPLLAGLTAAPGLPRGIVGMALLDLGTPALPALRDALTTGAPTAQALAAELLGMHGDLAATPALLATLADRSSTAPSCIAAAGALGRIGLPTATGALTGTLTTAQLPAVRRAAADALGRIGDPEAVVALTAGLADASPDVRAACADALAAIGDEGRGRLRVLSIAAGPAGTAARAALDVLALAPRRTREVLG